MADSKIRRWIVIIAGMVFAIYGICGVYSYRGGSIPVQYIVPMWWYLVASGPAVIAFVVGVAFPSARHCWRQDRLMNILMVTIFLSQIYIPIIYRLYFKNRS